MYFKVYSMCYYYIKNKNTVPNGDLEDTGQHSTKWRLRRHRVVQYQMETYKTQGSTVPNGDLEDTRQHSTKWRLARHSVTQYQMET